MTASPVPDIRDAQSFQPPYYGLTIDWALRADGTLDDTQALATAIVVALGTNGLADPTEELPDPDSTDRGGWWGDLDADTIWGAWTLGSKLWLLRRSAIESVTSRNGSTVARVLAYISLAIQPFVDAKVCSQFAAYAERVDKQRINASITIYRGPIVAVELRYQILWDELAAAQAQG
jgi:phage gp46-like protein